jgi:2-amino-4-hydroxy-6-hydroxymethyldihydropteridine diphosphokinase
VITAYIALGSNLGDKQQNIKQAIRSIKRLKNTSVIGISGLYRTLPEGNIPQPNFINAAIEIQTSLPATTLLKKLLRIEKTLGRIRVKDKLLPRTIDLDILLYGQKSYRLPHLTIPHPRMHQRRFVLEPLCELAPDLIHPVLHCPMKTLLTRI